MSTEEKNKIPQRYQFIAELGAGGMGKVYKVKDLEVGRVVALKVLSSNEETSRERFLREAQAMASLTHHRIIEIYNIHQNNHYCFTMEFVAGASLQTIIAKKKFSMEEVANLLMEVGDAIHYAHNKGIIHRDLKPENIMIDQNGQPKVMDFGLAMVKNEDRKLSMTGAILGTPFYMSPEQAEGKRRLIDERSDVYSLGVILYQMMTGICPFVDNNLSRLLKDIVRKEPKPPSKINQNIPKDLEAICLKAIAKQRENRYQSAAALVEDLQRFLMGEKIIARTRGIQEEITAQLKKYRRALTGFAIAFIVALVILSNIHYQQTVVQQKKIRQLQKNALGHIQQATTAAQIKQQHQKNGKFLITAEVTKAVEDALGKYREARMPIQRAVLLDPKNKKTQQLLYYLEKETGLLALLTHNYILSKIAFQRCAKISQSKGGELLEQLTKAQNQAKKITQEKIATIMDNLHKAPPEGVKEKSVDTMLRMKSYDTIEELLSYLKSSHKWQRIIALETLGKMKEGAVTCQDKTVLAYLVDFLKAKKDSQLIQDEEELEALVLALGRLNAIEALPKIKNLHRQLIPKSTIAQRLAMVIKILSEQTETKGKKNE